VKKNTRIRTSVHGGSAKRGLPPGSLVHIGEKRVGPPVVSVIDYSPRTSRRQDVQAMKEFPGRGKDARVRWVNVDGLDRIEIIEALGRQHSLHPLVLEDILHTGQRPKFEDHDSYYFIVLRMMRLNRPGGDLLTEQVSLIVRKNAVLTFQEGLEGDVFDPIRQRISTGKSKLRAAGADFLAYALMDAIVDEYFTITEDFGERIETVEDELVKNPSAAAMESLHRLKQELMVVRKAIYPLREVMAVLARGEHALLHQTTLPYLRDLHDHVLRLIETIEMFHEIMMSLMEMVASLISNRMNEIMKVLTIIATIFIPLTFLAGLYGMNFNPGAGPWNMPELQWAYGYPVVLLVMILMAAGMLLYFRKRHWL
jgi:magnesium transporter